MANIYWPEEKVFPRFSRPEYLDIVDIRNMDFFNDFKFLPLITLQGLVNKHKPQIYIILRDEDELWLKLIRDENIPINKMDLNNVMEKYRDYCKGYIIYDPNVPDTLNLANIMSGIYDTVIVNPRDISWIEGLGFKKYGDLRGRFKNRLEVYRWGYEELWPKCSHRLLVPMRPYPVSNPPRPLQIAVRDYASALKLFIHYLDPHNVEELSLFKKFLKDMPENSAILGWYKECEHITVRLASEYNKFVVVTTGAPHLVSNLTVWSGIDVKVKFKLPPLNLNKLGEDKVYVTFYINDGDNVQWDILMRKFWDDKYRGKIPIAWTVSPFLIDLAPLIMKYYAESMSENDTFVSGPSGTGYWYPNINPNYTEKFLDLARKYFERTGLKFTEILGEFLDGESLIHYSEKLNLLAIKLGYRGMDIFPYYVGKSPVPIIPGTVEYTDEKSTYGWLKAIATVYRKRPLHVLVICIPWRFKNLEPLINIVKKLSRDNDFNLINLHEFAAMLNPRYGIKLSKKILEEIKTKKMLEIAKHIERNLKEAERKYDEGRWRESLSNIMTIYRIAKQYLGKIIINE